MPGILESDKWDGISGIIAIITALVPVIAFIRRRFFSIEPRTNELQPVISAPVGRPAQSAQIAGQTFQNQSGCSRSLMSLALNCAVWLVQLVIAAGATAFVIGSSEEYTRRYKEYLESIWDNMGSLLAFTCVQGVVVYTLLFLLLVASVVIGFQKGYASGSYVMLVGNFFLQFMSVVYSKLVGLSYSSLYVPQIIGLVASLIFMIIVVWSTDLAVKRPRVLPASAWSAPIPGPQEDG